MTLKRIAYCCLMIGLFHFFNHTLKAQDQRIADSLRSIYSEDMPLDSVKLELLGQLAFNELNDLNLKIQYAEKLIQFSNEIGNESYLYEGYQVKGNAYRSLGDLDESLDAFFKSAEIANKINHRTKAGASYMAIGDVYSVLNDFNNSERYYSKAISILRRPPVDTILLGSALLNSGDDYFLNKKYDKAILYFEESAELFKGINYTIGIAYNLGNTGMVYAERGNDSLAEANINEAISILEEIKDYYPISVYLGYMADIYNKKKDFGRAVGYAKQSLELAEKYELKEQIRDANLKLAELNDSMGNFEDSITYLKKYYAYRDSIMNLEAVEEIANLRTDYEVSQKQAEVDLLNEQKKNQQLISLATGIGLLLILVLAIGLYRRNKFVNKAKLLIEKEKDRSDQLLLNILPEETATELKDRGKVKAKRFESVSVMFTDFKGFTAYSDKLSPEELVDSIDFYYSRFDEIVEKHGLEKIKTVGDAYMCAGGLNNSDQNNAHKMIAAAIEIADFVKESKKNDPDDMTRFDIRIGINTGPVVAGVVGKKKFAYDIWGDTVNIASRMESNSEPGKINVSEVTYELIKDQFICSYRGEIEAKNKGKMKMYFVERAIEQEIT